MNKKLLLLLVVLVLLFVGYKWWQTRITKSPFVEKTSNEGVEVENRVSEFLKKQGWEVPDGVEKATLNAFDGFEGAGVATREKIENKYLYTILAELKELDKGYYQGFVIDENGKSFELGNLRVAKGGFLVEKNLEVSGKVKVEVRAENKVALSGNFN